MAELWESAVRVSILSLAAVFTVASSLADAAPLPRPVAEMIRAAADDPDALAAVVKAAKKTNPDSVAEIDAQVAALAAAAEAEKARRLASQGFFQGWTGKGEFGGSISTGNSNDEGLAVALGFDKQTRTWVHDLNLAVDFKREDGATTKDRYFGAYSIRRNFASGFYAEGVLWAERDRFAGYNYRLSESVGLGYRLLDRARLKLRVEGGPALRQADYLTNGYETTTALRAASYLTWQATPRLELSQGIVGYLDTKNSTLLAAAAVSTRLQRKVSARASYEFRYEEDPAGERKQTDTTTRLTLVYSF